MKVEITSDDILTIEQAAEQIGCHHATLFRWIDEGKILTLKLAKNRAIPKTEVERLRRSDAKRKYERAVTSSPLKGEAKVRVKTSRRSNLTPLPKVKQPILP